MASPRTCSGGGSRTLDELAGLRDSVGGDLQVRVAPFVPQAHINVLDADSRNGLIVVQHYEHRPTGESVQIVCLRPQDGVWYGRIAAEAKRLWDDGISWPLDPAAALSRSGRLPSRKSLAPNWS